MQHKFITTYQNPQDKPMFFQQTQKRPTKKQLPKEVKRQIAFSLGPTPTHDQIKTICQQYNVCSGTVYYWLKTYFPGQFNGPRNGKPEFRQDYHEQQFQQDKEMDRIQESQKLRNSEEKLERSLEYLDKLLNLNHKMEKQLKIHKQTCQY